MKKIIKIFTILFVAILLVSCGDNKEPDILPNLTNKTQQEIETIFNDISKNISLSFEFEYSNEIDENVFIKYKEPLKAGEEVKKDALVVIVLAAPKLYLPELDNKDKEGILEAFSQITETLGEDSLTLNFVYQYPTDENENVFVSYLDGSDAGDVVLMNSEINIGITGSYAKYPDVNNKSESVVNDVFEDLFASYEDLEYEIKYKGYYDESLEEGTIISYEEGITVNEDIKDLNNIVLIRSFKTLILPNLRGLKLSEIIDLFSEMNIPESKLQLSFEFDPYVDAGAFTRYGDGLRAGDSFEISNNRLPIFYDLRPVLPNLEGLNKHQINAALANIDANITYEYILDNDQEYDTFAGYLNNEPGDEVISGMNLVVRLYENNDVNTADVINVEKQLMISKYISGSGNNLGIELYNPTDEAIILDDYYIAIIPGRQNVPDIMIPLTGTLNSKETYVIVNIGASSSELISKSDMQTTLMTFGANSTIQLRKTSNNTYIDTVYDIANSNTNLDREIFVRKSEYTHGRRNFVYTEWKAFVPDFYDLIGVHPFDGESDPVFELIADKTFQEYGMTKVEFISAADGDTVYFNSLDPRDTANYKGDNRIRFIIIDTPETQKPGQVGQPYAQVATQFTRNMLSNASEIYLQASLEAGLTETYGRHLGLIWANVGTVLNPNWKLLNYELLKAGLGSIQISKTGNFQNHPIFGNRYLYQWAQEADNYAKENKLGLYSGIHKD